jgi:tetratricopeptide (TPR) repeat protein
MLSPKITVVSPSTLQSVDSEECLTKATELNQRFFPAWVNKGAAFVSSMDSPVVKKESAFLAAIEACQKALALEPQSPHRWGIRLNLAIAYAALKQFPSALEEIEKSISLNPSSSLAFTWRGRILSSMEKIEEAMYSFRQAISLSPEDTSALSRLGQLYRKQNQIQSAIDSFLAVIRINPRDADVLYELGELYEQEGRLEEACQMYRQFRNLNRYTSQAEKTKHANSVINKVRWMGIKRFLRIS